LNVTPGSVLLVIQQLAEHLKACIKHGNEVVYRPGMPIVWDVRPIVNG